ARLFQSGLLVSISALACLLARPRLAAVAEIQQHCTVPRIKESLSESETSLSYASDLEAQKNREMQKRATETVSSRQPMVQFLAQEIRLCEGIFGDGNGLTIGIRLCIANQRQLYRDPGPLTENAGGGDVSAVGVHDRLSNSEAQAETTGCSSARRIAASKALKNIRQLVGRYAHSGIFHTYACRYGFDFKAQAHSRSCGAVLNCILQQIHPNQLQVGGIGG